MPPTATDRLSTRFYRCNGIRSLADDRRYPMQNEQPVLLVITAGQMWWTRDGSQYTATAGDVVYHPSCTPYVEWTTPDAPTRGVRLDFAWQDVPEALPPKTHDESGLIRLAAQRLLSIWFIERHEHDAAIPTVRACQLIFGSVIGELIARVDDTVPPLVRQVRDFTFSHMSRTFSLSELAAHVGANPSYLVRKYKTLTGSTPMAHIRQYRVAYARELVLATRLSVKELAAETGFADGAHLSREFRHRYGITISELRRGLGTTEPSRSNS